MNIKKTNQNNIGRYEIVDINNLKKYEKNSRTHSKDQINQLVQSIQEYGFTNPILIDENNTIIAGHARLEASKKLGLNKIPSIVLTGLTDQQKSALVIADNKLALNAGWNDEILKSELSFLKDNDFNLELTGFSFDELSSFFPENKQFLTDEDSVPEVSEPICKLGDVWILGDHRLMCGDSTNKENVERLVNHNVIDMFFTDPPYGVNFEQGKFIGRSKKPKDRNFEPIKNDDKKGDELTSFIEQVFSNAFSICDVCSIYAWSPSMIESFSILNAAIQSGWHMQSQIIWNKTPFVIGRADYHWKHEVCWYGFKGKNHKWFGGRDKSTVWDVKKAVKSDLHPTMKPVELAEIACNNSTKINDGVLDLFGGSGSTLIACEKTKRKCFMMELDPHYCDVIIKRWEDFTGNKAVLEV